MKVLLFLSTDVFAYVILCIVNGGLRLMPAGAETVIADVIPFEFREKKASAAMR